MKRRRNYRKYYDAMGDPLFSGTAMTMFGGVGAAVAGPPGMVVGGAFGLYTSRRAMKRSKEKKYDSLGKKRRRIFGH